MPDPNAPSPQPAAPSPPAAELLNAMPTDELRRLRNSLRSNIPGDGTWSAAVARVLTHLLDLNLLHPDRAARDEQAVKEAADAQAAAAKASLDAKHAAEMATASDAEKQALADKHDAEQAVYEHKQRLADLDADQAREREAFAAHQREQRAEMMAPPPTPPDRAGASTGL